MSIYNLWDKDMKEPKLKSTISSEWDCSSRVVTSRSPSPQPSKLGEAIFNNYLDLIHSKSNMSTDDKQTEPLERPFDFFDDEEFAFGINILNKNVACVGDDVTKLIQMEIMPEYPMRDSIMTSLSAQEPWPENVKLFQPYEVEQILLPDNASCLAVQAFLKMCNLPFEVEMRWNAEWMSPSGRVPFIKCGAFVVSELEPIVQFAANKGVSLCNRLSTEDKAEMRAYMSLITNVLVNAELYISWLDSETYNTVTKVRNSSVYPWPLGWLQTRAKRNQVAKRLKALHWYDKTLEQVLSDVEQCCNSLSQQLGDKDYFFNTPTQLDALACGHVRALLAARGGRAAMMVQPVTSAMLRHAVRVARLTGMMLTPQEEYLLTQAFRVFYKRRSSPERTRRSHLSVPNASRDSIQYKSEAYGFKPFACKQILMRTTKEGDIVCELNRQGKYTTSGKYMFIIDILEDVLDKVDELVFDNFKSKIDACDKNDFEVIAFPNRGADSKFGSIDMKFDELIDIDENVIECDTTLSLGTGDETNDGEDVLNIINDDEVMDSDGLVNEKLLAQELDIEDSLATELSALDEGVRSPMRKSSLSNELTDSSPSELDALVFGHIFTIITTRLPCRALAETVKKHESLVALAKRVDEQYFKRP